MLRLGRYSLWAGTIVGVGILLARAQQAAGADLPRPSQRWALLIGVNDYASVQDLRYCVADQEALANQLIASGFPKDQVFVLDDKAEQQKLRPSKLNIEKQLELVLSIPSEGDTLVLSFSGHGVQIAGKSYLCPADCDLERPAETMIAVDKVFGELTACKASLKLLIVDACRNDLEIGGKRTIEGAVNSRGFGKALETPPEGISLLTSCSPGQFAREHEKLGHGVFMHFVLEGLQGKAADDDGIVRLGHLLDYTSLNTQKYVLNEFNARQRPYYKLEGSGPVELVRVDLKAQQKPAASFTNSIGMALAWVPAGEFMMGSPLNEAGREDTEKLHRVKITKPFYIGKHETTLGQFLKFRQEANYKCEAEKNGTGFGWTGEKFEYKREFVPWSWGFAGQTNEHPVVNVSWHDATAFCNWLSRKENKRYRLPTEAEWEYAARAGTTSARYNGSGEESLLQVANVADQSTRDSVSQVSWGAKGKDGYSFTAPVGRFQPNDLGLYDMYGNAYEWCQDWYDKDYYASSPIDDPTGPTSSTGHVIRGGSWDSWLEGCRSANRSTYPTDSCRYCIGFRVVYESQ